jgi:hypothetical protein
MKTKEKFLFSSVIVSFFIVVIAIFNLIDGNFNSQNWPLLFILFPFLFILYKYGGKAIKIVKESPDEDMDRTELSKENDLRFPFDYKK